MTTKIDSIDDSLGKAINLALKLAKARQNEREKIRKKVEKLKTRCSRCGSTEFEIDDNGRANDANCIKCIKKTGKSNDFLYYSDIINNAAIDNVLEILKNNN